MLLTPRRACCERASVAAQGRSCSARWRTGRRSAVGRPARRTAPRRPASPRASWTARTRSWTRTSSRRGPPRARSGPGPPGPPALLQPACMPPRVRLPLLEVVVRQLPYGRAAAAGAVSYPDPTLQVRLEHMLRRLPALQDAAATARPTRLLPHLWVAGAVEASRRAAPRRQARARWGARQLRPLRQLRRPPRALGGDAPGSVGL